jgi:putative redox protein
MSEKVIVRQKKDFTTEFMASDPEAPGSEPEPVKHLQDLSPYGMLLAGLGSCTALVLHTYARNHGIDLEEAELTLEYQRYYRDDCRDCEEITDYHEEITESLKLSGGLSGEEREKLHKVSRHCPIQKMIENGVGVLSELAGGR